MCGYKAEMEEMLGYNGGLGRRMNIGNPFYFEDFNEEELKQVLRFKLAAKQQKADAKAEEAMMRVLMQRKATMISPPFGNGGEVREPLRLPSMLRLLCLLVHWGVPVRLCAAFHAWLFDSTIFPAPTVLFQVDRVLDDCQQAQSSRVAHGVNATMTLLLEDVEAAFPKGVGGGGGGAAPSKKKNAVTAKADEVRCAQTMCKCATLLRAQEEALVKRITLWRKVEPR